MRAIPSALAMARWCRAVAGWGGGGVRSPGCGLKIAARVGRLPMVSLAVGGCLRLCSRTGVLRQKSAPRPGLAMLGFGWVGETVEDCAHVALLAAAPRRGGAGLNWLALLAGLVVTMKAYWVALMVQPRVPKNRLISENE